VKFLDEVVIDVRSGKGGDGMLHFHREKFVPRGGPDGGDGGRGGHVVLVADQGRNTLLQLRYNPIHRAENGRPGGTNNCTGACGNDLRIPVPIGTIVRVEGEHGVLGDLTEDGQELVVAQGGKGGRGNAHFRSPRNRTPQQSEQGGPMERLRLRLELRLLADVGLVGLPNAGKSTLVSRISAARPRIADYPFTTLEPSLGVVRHGDYGSFVITDLPGLIAGAHEGQGLGHRFLRHVERTAVFLHLVSLEADLDPADPVERFHTVRDEVLAYREALGDRPALVGLSKLDVVTDRAPIATLAKRFEQEVGLKALPFSAATGEGIEQLVRTLGAMVDEVREEP